MDSKKPCIKVTDESDPTRTSSPKTVVVLDHHATLPAASSAFREVMRELNPPASPGSGCLVTKSPRRRKSSILKKHVHYVVKERDSERGEKLTELREAQHDERGKLEEGEDEFDDDDDEEEEEGDGDTQILHGMCHCYFVRNGTVTGLADQKCHHDHRNHAITYHPQHHAAAGTSASGKGTSPISSPRLGRKVGSASSPVPDWFHAAVNDNNNDSHKLPPLSPTSAGLLPVPDLGHEFRARSHSDTTAIERIQLSKRAKSLASGHDGLRTESGTAARGARGPPSAAGSLSPRRRGGGGDESPNSVRSPCPRRRGGSVNHNNNSHGGGLADSMNNSLRLSHSPPPIVVQEATTLPVSSEPPQRVLTSRDRARRSSAHTIPTEQLHYLYDQFLHPAGSGSPSPAGRRPRSASGTRP